MPADKANAHAVAKLVISAHENLRAAQTALASALVFAEDDYEHNADKLGDAKGDAPQDDLPQAFGVIVECDTEQQQTRLLAQLDGEGFRVRALMT